MNKEIKVVGYFPHWKMKKENKIRYDIFTHINYSFSFVDANSDFVLPYATEVENLIKKVHSNNKRILLGVGGWNELAESNKPNMMRTINDLQKANNFVKDIALTVKQLDFDGVDLCFSGLVEEDNIKNVKHFIELLKAVLKKDGKLLTISTFGEREKEDIKCFEVDLFNNSLMEHFDWINVINYELRTGVRSSNIKLHLDFEPETHLKVPSSSITHGIPFFVNVSLMAYEDDLKEVRGISEGKDIVTCGREIYGTNDKKFESELRWAKENTLGFNIWEITQDFSNEEESYLTKIKYFL